MEVSGLIRLIISPPNEKNNRIMKLTYIRVKKPPLMVLNLGFLSIWNSVFWPKMSMSWKAWKKKRGFRWHYLDFFFIKRFWENIELEIFISSESMNLRLFAALKIFYSEIISVIIKVFVFGIFLFNFFWIFQVSFYVLWAGACRKSNTFQLQGTERFLQHEALK